MLIPFSQRQNLIFLPFVFLLHSYFKVSQVSLFKMYFVHRFIFVALFCMYLFL